MPFSLAGEAAWLVAGNHPGAGHQPCPWVRATVDEPSLFRPAVVRSCAAEGPGDPAGFAPLVGVEGAAGVDHLGAGGAGREPLWVDGGELVPLGEVQQQVRVIDGGDRVFDVVEFGVEFAGVVEEEASDTDLVAC